MIRSSGSGGGGRGKGATKVSGGGRAPLQPRIQGLFPF